MSERILKALMQLFAIVAKVDDVTNKSRVVVQLFLKQQLNQELVDEYLQLYDQFLEKHHKVSKKKKDSSKKRTSLSSVKILRICTQINAELTQKQKVVVLLRLLEYVNTEREIQDQEMEFVTTVAEAFNISKEEFDSCFGFITCGTNNIPDTEKILVVSKEENDAKEKNKYIHSDTLEGKIIILSVDSVSMYAMRYFGTNELYLNGQIIDANITYILTPGSSIRSSKVQPIYYSDIISHFLSDESKSRIVFTAEEIEYEFKGGKKGLNELTFSEQSGKLIGIMGGSGAGKSTLLNVLNGNNPPSQGKVTVNDIDIHHEKDEIEGVIGYVSQDDLLIEELTVFQNLFYNAKLCFDGFSDTEITKMVLKILNSIGLTETKDLKVGSPLEKTISGGQRKRLNIALELIREPSVMFVDEPTSGLSSRDSEVIMDLLKELALKGKVIFVVIHQPSSEIFKMFDKLLILDVGGYPIYYGNPVDAVIYFKTITNHVNSNESECPVCGNVNPEQIFNIIEAKVLDEYGNLTDKRKISSKEWNKLYKEKLEESVNNTNNDDLEVPQSTFNIPNKFNQFKVFVTRDVLSKLTDKQYLSINLLEAPVLAFVLSFFIKFYDTDVSNEIGYIFRENDNLVAYMFMAVVVALFIGMTVSAEEIISDQKIRKRESFLNLSNGSYLVSKVLIMFVLSAIQTFTFIIVGNSILAIKGMMMDYWIILFSTACFANMLGLNISAAFNSAVTIYILIPFLLIPQLLFSGVIVKFDKLNPVITSQSKVPIVGDLMASRWAYEALAVNQFKNNAFEEKFYDYNKEMSIARFQKNFWLPKLREKIGFIENNLSDTAKQQEVEKAIRLLRNEVEEEINHGPHDIAFEQFDQLTKEKVDQKVIKSFRSYLRDINKFYIRMENAAVDAKDEQVRSMQKTEEDREAFNNLKNEYENESLSDMVTNKNTFNHILELDNKLIQKVDPVYMDPKGFNAHFYAPRKKLFGNYISTFWSNIMVLWLMSVILMITLYFDVFKYILLSFERAFSSMNFLSKSK